MQGPRKGQGCKAGSSGPEMLCHVQINRHPCLHYFAFSLNGARLPLELPIVKCVASQTSQVRLKSKLLPLPVTVP